MIEDFKAGRIRQKESVYRKLYSSLLRKHQGAVRGSSDDQAGQNRSAEVASDFDDEEDTLNRIFRAEVQNLLIGVGATALALATLRWGRYTFSTGLFGMDKAKAMQEAEVQAKRRGTEAFQKAFAFFVESTFSLWFGFRCYNYASHYYSDTSWEAIAELPLVRGRSRASEALCPEWIQVTNTQVPNEFWKALDENQLNDGRTWRVIRQFSVNCEKRLELEQRIRKGLSSPEQEPVVFTERIPSGTYSE